MAGVRMAQMKEKLEPSRYFLNPLGLSGVSPETPAREDSSPQVELGFGWQET